MPPSRRTSWIPVSRPTARTSPTLPATRNHDCPVCSIWATTKSSSWVMPMWVNIISWKCNHVEQQVDWLWIGTCSDQFSTLVRETRLILRIEFEHKIVAKIIEEWWTLRETHPKCETDHFQFWCGHKTRAAAIQQVSVWSLIFDYTLIFDLS